MVANVTTCMQLDYVHTNQRRGLNPRIENCKIYQVMVDLLDLPDEIVCRILEQPCLTRADVNKFVKFPSFVCIANKIVHKKSKIKLYFQPSCRHTSQGCSSHSLDMPEDDQWSVQVLIDSSNAADKLNLLQDYCKFDIFLSVSDFTINRLNVLQVMKLLRYKKLNLFVYFVLPYDDEIMHQILDFINVADNDVSLTIYTLYHRQLSINTYNLKLVNVLICSKSYITTDYPVKININQNCQDLKIENHFIYDKNYPQINYCPFFETNSLKSLEIIGLSSSSSNFINDIKNFKHLQSLKISKSNDFRFQSFIENIHPFKFNKLTKLSLIDCQIYALKDLNLDTIFPNLTIFHIENGNDNQFNLTNVIFPSYLKSLKLSRKSMKLFQNNSIMKLLVDHKLIWLDLSFNNLCELQLSDLCDHIYQVNLSYNRKLIGDIPLYQNKSLSNFLFYNITNLLLDGCNISNQTFERLAGLYDDCNSFKLSNLQYLSLSKNELLNLRCFNHSFFRNIPLRKLNLSYNKFRFLNQDNFPINKSTYPNIELIDLSGNIALSDIYDIRLDYDYLTLKLINTRIKKLPDEIFGGINNTVVYDL